jgi:hypothetical protein
MFMGTTLLVRWVLVGFLSTLLMDVGSALVRRAGFTAGLPPRLIGRWFALLARGQLSHRTIAEARAVPGELPLALITHYLIGITLTLAFCALLATSGLRPAPATGFALALGYGVLTNLLPWLWMFPSMGFGVFGRSGPPEMMLLRSSFVNHIIFGLGLAVSTRWFGLLRS